MSLYIVKNATVANSHKLVDMVYHNFEDLAPHEDLMHNKRELARLVNGRDTKIMLLLVNKKIVAYLIGEGKKLNDGRTVFFISYLYTAKKFRRKGYGSKLMNIAEKFAAKSFDAVVLRCDTEDEKVYEFYTVRGYMPDLSLRQYSRFEVLSK